MMGDKDPRTVDISGCEREIDLRSKRETGNVKLWEKGPNGEYRQRLASSVDAREIIASGAGFAEKPKGRSQVSMSGSGGKGSAKPSTPSGSASASSGSASSASKSS